MARSLSDVRRERARKRSVDKAQDHFKRALPGRFKGRANALARIAKAKRPLREAKRLAAWFAAQRDNPDQHGDDTPDHSDVQELRTQLLRRDGVVDLPQAMILGRMDGMVARNAIDRNTFNRLATAVVKMRVAWPKIAK